MKTAITVVNSDSGYSGIYIDGMLDTKYGYGSFDDPAAVLRALGLTFSTKYYSGEDQMPFSLETFPADELHDEADENIRHLYQQRFQLVNDPD